MAMRNEVLALDISICKMQEPSASSEIVIASDFLQITLGEVMTCLLQSPSQETSPESPSPPQNGFLS